MSVILYMSQILIPLFVVLIVGTGILKKRPVYDDFVTGAKDGIRTVTSIAPTLIGLMMGIGALRASGFLDFLSEIIKNISKLINFPSELIPLFIVKMFSSSAATGLLLDIYKEYGTDSFLGFTASIMLSSTETIFYTMSVYFLAAKVTKTRWTLSGAVLSSCVGVAVSVIMGMYMYLIMILNLD